METPSTNKYLNKDEEQAPLKSMYFYLMLKEFEASAREALQAVTSSFQKARCFSLCDILTSFLSLLLFV